MLIEHIAKGRYILDFVEPEEKDVTLIAIAFYKSNRANTIRKLIEGGIAVYKELLEQGFQETPEDREILKILADNLATESVEFTKET